LLQSKRPWNTLKARNYNLLKGKIGYKKVSASTKITFVEAHREGESSSKKLVFFAGK